MNAHEEHPVSNQDSTSLELKSQGPNVIMLSNAGKPIFSRYGNEEDLSNTCALLQAISSTTEENPIQSFRAGPLQIVISRVKYVTLVAISNNGGETGVFLRMLLEYVYAHVVFTLTEQVQQLFLQHKNCDVISLLGQSAAKHLYSMLDQAHQNPGPLITSAIPILYPLDYHLRQHASLVLKTVGSETPGILFALLVVGDKLVTLLQPKHQPHQLHVSDIHLILNFVKSQPFLTKNEAWFPICLPMFHSDGFLYTFTTCLDVNSGLLLMLISTNDSQEQFAFFREAATKIKQKLFEEEEEIGLDIKTLFHPINPTTADSNLAESQTFPLSRGIIESLRSITEESTFKQYCSIATAYHFIFRFDVTLPSNAHQKQKNKSKSKSQKRTKNNLFSQCLCPPLPFPFVEIKSKQRVWNMYQRLALRLKFGSASTDSVMNAYDKTSFNFINDLNSNFQHIGDDPDEIDGNGILSSCPAIKVFEPESPLQGITYILDESELFMALSGSNFLLMAVLPATTEIKVGAASCAKLVRHLMRDERHLFLGKPLTWRQ